MQKGEPAIQKIKVAVNGYGTIGRRVADAVRKQPDMELVGGTKATPDYRTDEAQQQGIKLFSINNTKAFEEAGYEVEGELNDLLQASNVVIDCSPKGKGKENLLLYSKYPGLRAIFQGGEKHELTGLSFNSDCNYSQAAGKRFARVVSCNTTALCRVISTLNTQYRIRKVRATLVRRSADQAESENGILNAWAPDMGFPSHHGHDVRTVIPGINISTLAGIAPMTLMHGHMLFIELEKDSIPADAGMIVDVLRRNPRILICSEEKGLTTTAKLKDIFILSRASGDIYEVCVWKEGVGVDESGEIGMHMAIDQQADVVPENIDAIRALSNAMPAEESIAMTNAALGIGKAIKNVAYVRERGQEEKHSGGL